MLIKMRNAIRNEEKGFTLIELIVVLAILAVLALIAIPKFAEVLNQSRFKTHNENIEMIGHAIELYDADHPGAVSGVTMAKLVSGAYLRENPTPQYTGATGGYTLAVTTGSTGSVVTITPGYARHNATTDLLEANSTATQVWPTIARPY